MGRRKGVETRGKSIRINFRYLGKTRFERIALPPTPRNLNYAERKRASIQLEIEKGTFDYLATFPDSSQAKELARNQGAGELEQLLRHWLDTKKHELHRSTYDDYARSVDILCRQFGKDYLQEFQRTGRAKVRDWINPQDISQQRAQNLLIPLRGVLADAFDDERISRNPLFGWKPKKPAKPGKSEVDPFNPEEMNAILNVCELEEQAYWKFAFWTGLRPSELIALEPSDFDKTQIDVNKGVYKGEIEANKTAAGNRFVKLLPKAKEAYQLIMSVRPIRCETVFYDPRYMKAWAGHDTLRKRFVRLCKKADVRYRKPYNTRHTFASMMLTAGEHHKWIANQLGHADLQVFYKVYGHLIEDDTPHGMKAVEQFGK